MNRKQKLTFTSIDWLASIFLVSVLISTLFSNDYIVSIKYTISLIWYFSAGYLVVRIFDFSRFELKISVLAFFAGMAILCLFVINNFIELGGIFYETSYKASRPFIKEGHTDLSVVIEPAFFLGFIVLLIIPWRNKKVLAGIIVCLVLFLAVIMFSHSKASYLALALSLSAFALLLVIRKPKVVLKLTYYLVPIIVVLYGIWAINDWRHYQNVKNKENSHYTSGGANYDPNNPDTYKVTNMWDEMLNKLTDTKKNDSNLERINRWDVGLDLFSFHPSFGIGMGTYPDRYLEFLALQSDAVEETYLTTNRMNLHNIFLGWLVEGGVITFLSGLGMIITLFIWFFSEYRAGKNNYIKLLILIYMISFIFHGFFHDFGQNARIIIPFWICLALVARQLACKKQIESSEKA